MRTFPGAGGGHALFTYIPIKSLSDKNVKAGNVLKQKCGNHFLEKNQIKIF